MPIIRWWAVRSGEDGYASGMREIVRLLMMGI
jgi:hypothetical protein